MFFSDLPVWWRVLGWLQDGLFIYMVYFDAKITEWYDPTILNLLSYLNRFWHANAIEI